MRHALFAAALTAASPVLGCEPEGTQWLGRIQLDGGNFAGVYKFSLSRACGDTSWGYTIRNVSGFAWEGGARVGVNTAEGSTEVHDLSGPLSACALSGTYDRV